MRFIEITPTNEHFVNAIFAGDEAQYWVHYNRHWLDNSRRIPEIAARLITVEAESEPIGFIAYGPYYADEDLTERIEGSFEIIHLVIDVKYQRRGYGRQATLMALDRLKSLPQCHTVLIAHNPNNQAARHLYESLGFTEFSRNYDGDPLLRLAVR